MEEEERKERRVKQMLKTYYGVAPGKLEEGDDPTSLDSAAFDLDLYFNHHLLLSHDLSGLEVCWIIKLNIYFFVLIFYIYFCDFMVDFYSI